MKGRWVLVGGIASAEAEKSDGRRMEDVERLDARGASCPSKVSECLAGPGLGE